ncbi:MAG TPA: hypothetical protein VMI73_25655 [Trebonia sp.]|nr:hypothetical protein [Trebonia sp.]
MRSTLTRFLVGAAIAATAVGTAVGTAGAAGATAKTHTTLSIVAGRSTITAGQTDTVSGTLRAADKSSTAKKTVELKRYNVKLKKWVLEKANLTGKNGWVRFTVKPSVTSRFELVFAGNKTLAASHSGVVTIHVKPAVVKTATSLTIAANPSTITAGSTTTISGDLTAGTTALPKRLVYLYRWNATAKHWDKVSVNVTGPKGGVSFTRKPPAGSVTFELVFFGSPKLAAAHSAPVTVTVNS